MSKRLADLIPDSELLLSLEPEELAGPLLEVLASTDKVHQYNFCNALISGPSCDYPDAKAGAVQQAVMEAWFWLVANGLLVPDAYEGPQGWYRVTRRGRRVVKKGAFDEFRKSSLVPRDLLHPTLRRKAWPAFIRGDHDTAVFQAFKEVEIAVRKAGRFDDSHYGVDLMRKAFHENDGPLSDGSLPVSERASLSHLFAGAIGWCKNPTSHRALKLNDPLHAAEMMMLASHLLRIVDERGPRDSEQSE